MALQVKHTNIAHHEERHRQLKCDKHCAQSFALRRQSERAFQHKGWSERSDIYRRINSRCYTQQQTHHKRPRQYLQVITNGHTSRNEFLHFWHFCQQIRYYHSYYTCEQGNRRRFTYKFHPLSPKILTKNPPCVDAFDAHRTFRQRKVQEVDTCHHNYKQTSEFKHKHHTLVALVEIAIQS